MATKKKRVPASKPKASTPRASAKRKLKPKPKSRSAAAKRQAVKSVDGLLKSFDKEKVTLNANLVSSRKKIERLTKQLSDLKTELEDSKRELVETELAIESIDSRRDQAIGTLLHEMGVDLGKVASAANANPVSDQSTPLFDGKPSVVVENGEAESAAS